MREHSNERGASITEFAVVCVMAVPMILGSAALGVNMLYVQQTEQLAHEAGRLFAAGLDMSQPGNQTILSTVGTNLGLSTTSGSGNAVVILSALTYVSDRLKNL